MNMRSMAVACNMELRAQHSRGAPRPAGCCRRARCRAPCWSCWWLSLPAPEGKQGHTLFHIDSVCRTVDTVLCRANFGHCCLRYKPLSAHINWVKCGSKTNKTGPSLLRIHTLENKWKLYGRSSDEEQRCLN